MTRVSFVVAHGLVADIGNRRRLIDHVHVKGLRSRLFAIRNRCDNPNRAGKVTVGVNRKHVARN